MPRSMRAMRTVSIHTRHFWRVNSAVCVFKRQSLLRFNPHPPFLAGEFTYSNGKMGPNIRVSIHTRHFWRVNWRCRVQVRLQPGCFNPHPPFLAGEFMERFGSPRGHRCNCFNPHPPFLAGEFPVVLVSFRATFVSIHTRHFWRVN